jgi:RND family efflux transporter MFP subunit
MNPEISTEPAKPPSEEPKIRPKRFCLRVLLRRLDWRAVCVLVIATIVIPLWKATTSHAKPEAAAIHTTTVAVAKVARQDLCNEISIPAEFRPYQQVELHAKVSGFLQQINVDIGDRVKAGQLLAKLEVPELKDELDRGKAAEKRAEADYSNAHLIFTRLTAVDKDNPNLVAQQDLDSAQAKDQTAEAAIAGAKAEVEKYETMLGYTRITAPFDGVITRRYADPGALIQAGTASETQSLPLVRISDNSKLRLDFPVSVAYVKDIHNGDPVEMRVESLGGKIISGKIIRSTQRVDEETRTMITEVEVPNDDFELIPGMYATAILKVQKRPQVLTIPSEALSSSQKTTVYVVDASNEIQERTITLGLETPTRYEVVSGLNGGDLVLVGSRSQVHPGEKVETKVIGSLAQE